KAVLSANRKASGNAIKKMEQFFLEQAEVECLQVTPGKMQQRLKEKHQELLQGCWEELQGDDFQKKVALEELEQESARMQEASLLLYRNKYKEAVLSANRKAAGNAMKELEKFVLGQAEVECLQVTPGEMQQQLKEKHQELLQGCREELLGDDSQKQAILEELEQESARKQEASLVLYREKYKDAVSSANRVLTKGVKEEFAEFLNAQDHDTQTEEQCLQVEPNELQQRLERKYHDLLQHCQGKMMGEEPQKEDTLGKLGQKLRESSEEFLHTYRQQFRQMENSTNLKAKGRIKQQFEEFIQEQDHDTQTEEQCLQLKPSGMWKQLEEKYQDLLQHLKGRLMGEEPQKEDILRELEEELRERMNEFLLIYNQRFRQIEAKERIKKQFEEFIEEQKQDSESMFKCLKMNPNKMRQHLEKKRDSLLQSCSRELSDEKSQISATREMLETDLKNMMEDFFLLYEEHYKKKFFMMCVSIGAIASLPIGAGIGAGVAAAVIDK
ncbi:trichohyalin-like, partial [Alligator sinensis]|uniref:Trichohyalin-like n=1 Tax=Alligator sinensis TaxID=38654 RepID=A0A3Q0FYK8_ALLSI